MSKRYLYIVERYPVLTETFVQSEVEGLRKLGLDVHVLALDSIQWSTAIVSALRHPLKSLGMVHALRQETRMKRRLSGILRASGVSSRCGPVDHIHAHFLGMPAVVAYCLSEILNVPYSLSAHARDIYVDSTPEIVVQSAQFRTACTESNARYVERLHPGVSFELIRHGVHPKPFRDRPFREDDVCRLLGVGRLVEKKGITYLIQACRILRDDGVQVSCTLVGDGPLRSALEKEITECGLAATIIMKGSLCHEAVMKCYEDADIMVVPSVTASDNDRDGIPNVLLEAMASALPVIATDAGSIEEVLQHETTGLVVPQHNPSALAEAIQRLWNDPILRTQLVRTSQDKIASEFNLHKWLSKLHDLFGDCEETAE